MVIHLVKIFETVIVLLHNVGYSGEIVVIIEKVKYSSVGLIIKSRAVVDVSCSRPDVR